MKRTALVMVLGVLAAGCATNKSVKKEIDPLAERLTALEQKEAATDAKLGQLNVKMDAQATELQGLRQQVAESTAATRDAVTRAEAAAQKSTKAFELMQVKGTKAKAK